MGSRVTTYKINGKEYPLCFTMGAAAAMMERYGGIDKIADIINTKDEARCLTEAVWMLGQLLHAGCSRARLMGEDSPEPPGVQALYDLLTIGDLHSARVAIMGCLVAGSARNVEADPVKNAEATPGD